MKYIIIFMLLVLPSSCISSKKQILSEETYYKVGKDGTVNKDSIIEIRKFIYDKEWKFISGTSLINGRNVTLISDANEYYVLPLEKEHHIRCEYDSIGRIFKYQECLEGSGIVEHSLLYDGRSNLSEYKSNLVGSDNLISIFTYSYFYLDDFTHVKRDGQEYISGMEPNYTNPWLTRTIRHNGKIVQYTERKIQN